VTDLERWLEAHGLGKYAKVFADNDVDLDVLADLTDADLERLGLSLGHRRKLLHALETERRGPAAAPPPHAPVSSAVADEAPGAERRQITVLFCDLVGSVELANLLDPEDASALIRRYQDACAGAVARFDGYVAKFMGDGVFAYFGYPEAKEDAAEHAVRSALAIVDAVGQIERPDGRACQVRIGISTGVVVVGDQVGTGSARERSIAGETPNLAARLQAIADPDAIIIGGRTHRLLGESFEYEDLGERTLKGFAAPAHVWRVLRETAAESRFAAMRAASRRAFVGRSEESSRLFDLWRRATKGEGQAVLISGEAGMGKSRLADALTDRIASERCYHVTCQCSPYHTNSALYPVIRHLERAAGFAPDDPDAVKLAKLEVMLGITKDSPPVPAAALIADLLSLPVERYPAIELAPPQRKAATLAALVELLTRLAADAPVLLLLEDAHWIDPTTKELWTRLIDAITATRLLALITARPEFASPWTGCAHVSSLELTRLGAEEAADLVGEISAPRTLEPALVRDIVTKSDGVPLYLEELTKSVLESSTPDRPAVPATLHDSLLARLDRLGPAKEIAQVAAVIGQQFSHALLAAVVSHSATELAAGLLRLIEAGLAYHRGGRAAEASYSFKHALVRDVAYENLLRARRAQLHERIGRALVENFSSIAESEPELLAHHFHHAGLFDLALAYRERAGDRAVARSSYAEAAAHFSAALAEAAQLPQGPDRTRSELALLLKLGPPITILKGPQHAEAEEVYGHAHERAAQSGDQSGLFKATWGLWYNAVIGRRLGQARDRADELMTLGGSFGDGDLLLEAFHCRWSTAMFRGELLASWEAAGEGVRRYDRAKHSWMGPVFGGHDPGVCAHTVQAITLASFGRKAEAWRSLEQSFSLAEDLGQANTRSHVLLTALVATQLARDCTALAAHARRAIDLADKYNLPPLRAHAALLSGWALAFGGDLDTGVAAMETEYPRASAVGPFFRYYAALLAEGLERAGRFADALAVLRPALATVTEPGVGIFVSELFRVQGSCLLRTDGANKDEAMHSLHTAVEVAKQQHATVLELRATMSLARAAIAVGRPTEGLKPLGDLCAALPAGFDANDLAEARQVLAGATRPR
jgi:class 3 adenylate cyclase/predicted ATPase